MRSLIYHLVVSHICSPVKSSLVTQIFTKCLQHSHCDDYIHSMCILLYIYFNVFILPFGFIVCLSYTYCACLGVAAVLIHKSSLDNMHMWHVKYMYMVHTQIFVYNTDNISNYFLTMDFAFKILPLRLC